MHILDTGPIFKFFATDCVPQLLAALGNSAIHVPEAVEFEILDTPTRRPQLAAQRWKTDPQGEYARGRRAVMSKTHRKKKVQGTKNRQKVGQFVNEYWIETDRLPTWREIQSETGFSRATVARHIASLKELGEWPEA